MSRNDSGMALPRTEPVEDRSASVETARRKNRKRAWILGILFLLGVFAGIDAFFIEPDWVQVTRHKVNAPLRTPVKILHLSDVHTHGIGPREKFILNLIAEEKPDLIVLTGDVIGDTTVEARVYPRVQEFLQYVKAPLGVYVVRGNWELWHPVGNEKGFYKSVGAELLVNESRKVREDFWVAGFDDAYAGRPNFERTVADIPPGAFTIGLFHSPVYFDEVGGNIPLAFAGHTHGGQVRVPFFGALVLPPGCGKYLEGWYEKNGSRMYVSRGVGTSIIKVRFWCRPEVAIYTVGPG
jgi:uncharacterized protein